MLHACHQRAHQERKARWRFKNCLPKFTKNVSGA